jgi:hypothetical protein
MQDEKPRVSQAGDSDPGQGATGAKENELTGVPGDQPVAEGAVFHIDLGHVDLGHVDLGHVDLGHVDLGHIDIPPPHIDIPPPHIDLGHIDLGHIDLGHVDLGHVDLGHVDLGHVDLGHFDLGHFDIPFHIDIPFVDIPLFDDAGGLDAAAKKVPKVTAQSIGAALNSFATSVAQRDALHAQSIKAHADAINNVAGSVAQSNALHQVLAQHLSQVHQVFGTALAQQQARISELEARVAAVQARLDSK